MTHVEVVLGVIAHTGLIPKNDGRLTDEYLAHLHEAVNAPENPVHYLAIDPGKANGVCGYDARYYLVFMLTIASDDMVMFLHQFEHIKVCIMEGYKVFPNKAKEHVYSSLETPRIIGRIESWAELKEIELVVQPPNIKPTGYRWLGEKPLAKSNRQNHVMDAHVHFTYWAVTHNRIDPAILLRRNRNG